MADKFTDILVGVRLDNKTAKEMEEDLNGRFSNVGRHFSQSILRNLKRSITAAALTAVFGVITTDIKKLNDEIDNTIDKFDSIIRAGKRFEGVSPEEYFRASRLFQVAGVQNFDELYGAYQREHQRANMGAPSVLREYKGEQIGLESFLSVLTALQKQGTEQSRGQIEEVFGKGQYYNVAQLLNTDLAGISKKLYGGRDVEGLFEGMESRIQQARILGVRNEILSLQRGAANVTPGVVQQRYDYQNEQDKITKNQLQIYGVVADMQLKLSKLESNVQEITNKFLNATAESTQSFISTWSHEGLGAAVRKHWTDPMHRRSKAEENVQKRLGITERQSLYLSGKAKEVYDNMVNEEYRVLGVPDNAE